MAKRPNEHNVPRPNSQLRVLFVELNGADTTIEEALRTVERMRRSPDMLQQQVKRIASASNSGDGQTPPFESPTSASLEPDHEQPTDNDGEPAEQAATAGTRQKRGQGSKKDRNAGIELIGNLDFVAKDKIPLKTFFAAKAPASDQDQTLVLCHYLQHTLELPSYGPGQILSGFKHVEKPVPVDLKQTIRNLKKDKAWLSFTDIEKVSTTTEGDNRVEHELGKASSRQENE